MSFVYPRAFRPVARQICRPAISWPPAPRALRAMRASINGPLGSVWKWDGFFIVVYMSLFPCSSPGLFGKAGACRVLFELLWCFKGVLCIFCSKGKATRNPSWDWLRLHLQTSKNHFQTLHTTDKPSSKSQTLKDHSKVLEIVKSRHHGASKWPWLTI